MMNLELSNTERDELLNTLNIRLSGLTDEIFHTDARDFRDTLKQRRELLEAIRGKLH